MATSKWRGHEIYFSVEKDMWCYCSDNTGVYEDTERACGHCNLPNRADDCDPCLGKLEGVMNACCGHGIPAESYIQFKDGLIVRGFIKDVT